MVTTGPPNASIHSLKDFFSRNFQGENLKFTTNKKRYFKKVRDEKKKLETEAKGFFKGENSIIIFFLKVEKSS